MEGLVKILLCLAVASLASCRILPEQDMSLFQGDIVLTPEQKLRIDLEEAGVPTFAARNAGHWPNPRSIPYEIHEDLKKHKRATDRIAEAITEIQQKTCIRLRPRVPSDNSGITFGPGRGCSSPVGYNSYFKTNYISLAGGCWTKGIIIHEIMHSLGFWHEQSRPDRDNYVIIHDKNIHSGGQSQFRKMSSIDSMGSPYDYDSILHYGTYYFSNGKGKSIETINPKDQHRIGQRSRMSVQDIWQLNKLYCEDKKVPSTSPPHTTSPSSPNTGVPYCIRHYGGMYLTVDLNENVVKLTRICTDQFQFLKDQFLQHINSKMCVKPKGNGDGSKLTLSSTCDSTTEFRMTSQQSIIHMQTKKCVHPEGGSEFPKDGAKLVIYNGCNQRRLRFTLIKSITTLPPTVAPPVSLKYCIRHSGGLYVTVSADQKYVQLTTTCKNHFFYNKDNSVQDAKTKLCLRPSRTGNGAVVSLSKTCDSLSHFQVTMKGSLQHVSSKKCIHPSGGSSHPKDNTVLVIYSGCDQQRLTFSLIKAT